ncbi:MAG: ORF6N domain-containing protein [Candidatus Gastranaerophilales bacterium]|nr:ORF6N domain-containing protein [Candidatus Gastranaerophilales bacterium]
MPDDLTNTNLIENRIFTIRGQRVMLDRDLAELYGVKTFRLNEAVKRNIKRFPNDFMFKLNDSELKELIANCDRFRNLKHSSNFPYAFTEQGVAMLASILNSETAIEINIQIVRTFIRLRQYTLAQTSKNAEIEELKKMLMLHIENTDNRFNQDEKTIQQIISVLNNLIEKPKETKRIGFRTE